MSKQDTQDLSRLASFPSKPRVFILSDIENEPDDQQSLVRYLLYSNEFYTRGICATTSVWLTNRTAPETMHKVIEAYGKVVDNLNNHVHPDSRYPPAKDLAALVTSGAPVYGKEALKLPPSDGAQMLVNRLGESTEPLWVIAWGGSNVIAEALQDIQRTKSLEDQAALRSRLRVYAISDQDDTGEWIRNTFPDVFYICSIHGFSAYDMAGWLGISNRQTGGDFTKVSPSWLRENIQRGPLGSVYPDVMYMMEGDTPTFLYLMQNGLGSPEYPQFGSWGGRYRPINVGSVHYADVVDIITEANGSKLTDNKATVRRWRDHFQNDFATRMSWSLTSDFRAVSHPPVPIVNGHVGPAFITLRVKSNDKITLDARESYNPDTPGDNSELEFQWYQYLDPTINHPAGALATPRCVLTPLSPPPGTDGTMSVNDAGFENVALGPQLEVVVPDSKAIGFFNKPPTYWLPHTGVDGLSYHIILQVTSTKAAYPLRRYLRIILDAGLS